MTNSDPQETDPAEAFEGVRRELSLLHRAVEGLTAARDAIPDYSDTLGSMDQALRTIGLRLRQIQESPAVSLSPAAMAQEINRAAQVVRAEDRKALHEAGDALSRSLSHIDALAKRRRETDEQKRLLLWVGAGAFVCGILLWLVLPGAVARSLPESWHMPERMAARMMGEPTLWDSGSRMMRADNPAAWSAVTHAVESWHGNRAVIAACEKAAAKARGAAQCIIKVSVRRSSRN